MAKRFGVGQGEQIRLIDDYSRFFTNACVSTDELVDIDGMDSIAAISETWIEIILMARQHHGKCRVRCAHHTTTRMPRARHYCERLGMKIGPWSRAKLAISPCHVHDRPRPPQITYTQH